MSKRIAKVKATSKATKKMHKREILHFRLWVNGELLPCGGATAVYEPKKNGHCEVRFSLCSLEESYNRKKGVAVALE